MLENHSAVSSPPHPERVLTHTHTMERMERMERMSTVRRATPKYDIHVAFVENTAPRAGVVSHHDCAYPVKFGINPTPRLPRPVPLSVASYAAKYPIVTVGGLGCDDRSVFRVVSA